VFFFQNTNKLPELLVYRKASTPPRGRVLSEERIRSFVAVDIDNQIVLDSFRELYTALKDTGADLKLVDVNNLHITIKFLGDLSRDLLDEVCGIMDEIKFQPFDVELKEVGVFPSMRRVNVVWVGMERGEVELLDIFNQLESRLGRIGFKPDRVGFVPHITVARVRSGRNRDALTNSISSMKSKEFGIFGVNSIKLKKSVLTPQGPIYSTLHEAKAKL